MFLHHHPPAAVQRSDTLSNQPSVTQHVSTRGSLQSQGRASLLVVLAVLGAGGPWGPACAPGLVPQKSPSETLLFAGGLLLAPGLEVGSFPSWLNLPLAGVSGHERAGPIPDTY